MASDMNDVTVRFGFRRPHERARPSTSGHRPRPADRRPAPAVALAFGVARETRVRTAAARSTSGYSTTTKVNREPELMVLRARPQALLEARRLGPERDRL